MCTLYECEKSVKIFKTVHFLLSQEDVTFIMESLSFVVGYIIKYYILLKLMSINIVSIRERCLLYDICLNNLFRS